MSKKSKGIDCPCCKGIGTVQVCQDSISVFGITKNKSGTYKIDEKPDHELTNYLDEIWLECSECSETSETSRSLSAIAEKIF